jgi:hypothetical protein
MKPLPRRPVTDTRAKEGAVAKVTVEEEELEVRDTLQKNISFFPTINGVYVLLCLNYFLSFQFILGATHDILAAITIAFP